jgi:hypothetical protein
MSLFAIANLKYSTVVAIRQYDGESQHEGFVTFARNTIPLARDKYNISYVPLYNHKVRQYDGDNSTVRWWQYDITILQEYDDDSTTVRWWQYDGDNTTVRYTVTLYIPKSHVHVYYWSFVIDELFHYNDVQKGWLVKNSFILITLKWFFCIAYENQFRFVWF